MPFSGIFVENLKAGNYNLFLSQTQYRRLQHPYADNCTDKNPMPNPMSTTIYSKSACLRYCLMKIWLTKCQDVPDFYQQYIQEDAYRSSNFTQEKVSECLRSNLNANRSQCDCPLACEETNYLLRFENPIYLKSKQTWNIFLHNQEEKVTKIQQVPAYTMEDLLGAAGGILGLAIGASSLSVVELLTYFVLYLVRKIY